MSEYKVVSERGRHYHVIRVSDSEGRPIVINGHPVYMDFTPFAIEAEAADDKAGYHRNGPRLGQEVEKAKEYADYVASYAYDEDYLSCFNTVRRARSGKLLVDHHNEPLRGYTVFCDHSRKET